MPRLRNSQTGRIINVDDDQVKAFKELGYKQHVKGGPTPPDAQPDDSGSKKTS